MDAREKNVTVYPSQRDAWLVAALWAAALGMVFAGIAIWSDTAPLGLRVGITVLLGMSAVLLLWVFISTSYTLSGDELLIRSGPFRWTVPFESIDEVSPTRSLLSGPALSTDRLRVRFRGSRFGIMISPKEKQAFLRDLVSRARGLRAIGDRVVREHQN